ncbi:hypothetical protein UFOVP1419_21 [uncultured Caudovirales phage]|uniref:Uncharacterized protein n=1 Tax=uncultured Caudovirales phage TaxID=2100421 RepID=A0A6J5SDW1_9CAUD|nr:hypothetical protein UFOVP1419_21 [uncultured Caudovirales phage]
MSATFDLGVIPVAGERGRYLVSSVGVTGGVYLVELDDRDGCGCGCRDYEVRSGMMLYPAPDCKHLRRARQYRFLQRQFTRIRG